MQYSLTNTLVDLRILWNKVLVDCFSIEILRDAINIIFEEVTNRGEATSSTSFLRNFITATNNLFYRILNLYL